MKCRICNSLMKKIDKIRSIKGHVTFSGEPYDMPVCFVDLYVCLKCGHYQIENFIEETFYDEYEFQDENISMYYSQTENIYNKRLEKLWNFNHGESLIDIGCGTGDFMQSAGKYYNKVVGIEPSVKEYSVAIKKGLSVIHAYFDDNLDIKEKFDAVACNMVFEHLENPCDVLKKMNDILNEGGCGLISIPDGEKIVNDGLYHQFLLEHINYFSLSSISKLAHDCGFCVLEVERNSQLLEINVYLRKVRNYMCLSKVMDGHKMALHRAVEGCDRILLWGAGIKAATYSVLLEDIKVDGIVDSDHQKTGKYIAGIKVPIEGVTAEKILGSDVIIILSSFVEEIIEKIRAYGYARKVVYFAHADNSVQVINF